MALSCLGRVEGMSVLGCMIGVVGVVTVLSVTATAQTIPVFISDDFNRDSSALNGQSPPVDLSGDAVWSSPVTYFIVGNRIQGFPGASAHVPFDAPMDSRFSVEATTFRDLGSTDNHSINIGFADNPSGKPGQHISGMTALTLSVNIGGDIALWEDAFCCPPPVVLGKTLEDVGLPLDYTDALPMLLEIDPVNNMARAEVNNVEVYNISYTVPDPITWAGVAQSSVPSSKWDDFAVRAFGELVRTTFEWRSDRSGAWNATSSANWSPTGVPNSNEHSVVFGDEIQSPRVVFVDSDVTAKAITFDNTNKYVVMGTGVINLDADTGNAALTVMGDAAAGDHEFQAVVTLEDNTEADIGTGASLTFNNALNLGSNSLMKMGGGTLTINNQLTTSSGTVSGLAGTIAGSAIIGGDLNNVGATISPGNSPGVFEIAGDYTQGADGSLVVELGGTEAGVDHDLLKVGGDAVLAGQLEVTLIGDFQPAGGETFSILDAGSVTGMFDMVSLPDLTEGLAWDDSGLYTDGSLTVIPEPGTLVLLSLGLLGLASWWRWRRRGISMLGCVLAVVAAMSTSAAAQNDANATVAVIADNFNRADGTLQGQTTQIGDVTWDATYNIEDTRITGFNQHAYVLYDPPTDSIFSVEATTWRDLESTNNKGTGIGFSDIAFGEPSPGTGAATALTLVISVGGTIDLWQDAFCCPPPVASGKTLEDVNLPLTEAGPIDMLLELDPVNDRARAEVNGIEVYDISYFIPEPITWVGMMDTGVLPGAHYDEFVVREGVDVAPTTFEWHHDHSGAWNTGSHWAPAEVPNANNHTVIFGDSNLQPRAVYHEIAVTAKSIQFDSPNGYAIGGLESVNLEADIGNASISVSQPANQGDHQFQGVVNLQSTTDVDVVSNATLVFDNALNLNGQTMTKTGGGAMMINSQLNQGGGEVVVTDGVLGGSGEVGGHLTNVSGTVAPGQSAGTLTVEDNYTQEVGGTLQIEIGGLVRGAEHDLLDVMGGMDLNGGTLEVVLIDGFNPVDGDAFKILDFSSRSGGFGMVTLPDGGIDWKTENLLSVGILSVGIIVGDMDCDEDVDFDDIIPFVLGLQDPEEYENQFGVPPETKGDTDLDGDLDFDDITGFVEILSNTGGQQAVPEPQSIVLLTLGLLASLACRRRS